MKPPHTKIQRTGSVRAHALRQSIARELRQAREDVGFSQRAVARAAGISSATMSALERGSHDPSTEVLARVAAALGMDLSVRLYPNTGPLVRDHIQAAMLTATLAVAHPRWQPSPEVPVRRPVRGVIDLVLVAVDPPLVAVEAHSDLRRIEQQIRWASAKAEALAQHRGRPVSPLLLLCSTRRLRAIAAEYEPLLAAAYPATTAAAHRSLTGESPWPGPAILWCRYESGRARLLPGPPRGVSLGR